MSWVDKRLAALDIETTSVDVETARIVSATVALVGGGEPPDVFSLIIDPGVEIPEGASAVHGITNERAEREGVSAYNGVAAICARLDEIIRNGLAVCAMNLRYDTTVIDRECSRHGVEAPDWTRLLAVDVMVTDRHLHRFRKGSRKLDALCTHYGVKLDNAHDAEADALAAARVAWVIGKRGQIIRRAPRSEAERMETAALHEEWNRVRSDLPALHAAQQRWAYEQAAGLEEHFTKTGQPQAVPRDWPVIPKPQEGQHDSEQRAAA